MDATVCASCGWKEPGGMEVCSQCGRRLDGTLPPPPPEPESVRTFSLRTLFLAVTLISVWVAVAIRFPMLGVSLLFVVFPAFIRTAAIGRSERYRESQWGWSERNIAFVESLVLFWIIAVVSGVAFLSISFALMILGDAIRLSWRTAAVLSAIIGGCGALVIGALLTRFTWPESGHSRSKISS